jgi:hypothetical protein
MLARDRDLWAVSAIGKDAMARAGRLPGATDTKRAATSLRTCG